MVLALIMASTPFTTSQSSSRTIGGNYERPATRNNAQDTQEVCPVCLENFSDRNIARFLPCGNYHSFCEICLRQLVSENRTHFPCPVCRQLVQIPQGGVTAFPRNRYVRLSNRQQPSSPIIRTDRQRILSAQVRRRAQEVEEDADIALQMQIQEINFSEAGQMNYNQPTTRAPVPGALPGPTENQPGNNPMAQILPPTQVQEREAVITNADMSEDMQQDAVDCTALALGMFTIEKDIAAFIKKEFDKKYNPTWHCIVGRNFGSYVTHETNHFIHFHIGSFAILLFKHGYS